MKAKFVICVPETAEKVIKAVELSNFSQTTKVFSFEPVQGCINLQTLLQFANPNEVPEPVDASDIIQDVLLVFWSSGTTGLPKGICHGHFSSWNAFNSIGSSIMDRVTNAIVTTTCFFHIGGFFTSMRTLCERQSNYHVSCLLAYHQIRRLIRAFSLRFPDVWQRLQS